MLCTNLNKRICVKILQPQLNFSNNSIYIHHRNIFSTDFCLNKWWIIILGIRCINQWVESRSSDMFDYFTYDVQLCALCCLITIHLLCEVLWTEETGKLGKYGLLA